jgi:CheY-like chemotaxis protein
MSVPPSPPPEPPIPGKVYHPVHAEVAKPVARDSSRRSYSSVELIHELSNLLVPLLGHATFALDELSADHPSRESISNVLHGARVMANLVRAARDGGNTAPPVAIDLVAAVRDGINLLRGCLPGNVGVVLTLAPQVPFVRISYDHVYQLVMNLGLNAIQALREGGGTVEFLVDVVASEEPQQAVGGDLLPGVYARLSVADNGRGIEMARLAELFAPGFTTKSESGGMGLGLSIVQQITEAAGGRVIADSAPGRGSCFRLHLPVESQSDSGSDPFAPGALRIVPQSVLCMDLDDPTLAFATKQLRRMGHSCRCYFDSGNALRAIADDPECVELLLTSVEAHDRSGIEWLAAVRRLGCEVPALVVTGNPVPDEAWIAGTPRCRLVRVGELGLGG